MTVYSKSRCLDDLMLRYLCAARAPRDVNLKLDMFGRTCTAPVSQCPIACDQPTPSMQHSALTEEPSFCDQFILFVFAFAKTDWSQPASVCLVPGARAFPGGLRLQDGAWRPFGRDHDARGRALQPDGAQPHAQPRRLSTPGADAARPAPLARSPPPFASSATAPLSLLLALSLSRTLALSLPRSLAPIRTIQQTCACTGTHTLSHRYMKTRAQTVTDKHRQARKTCSGADFSWLLLAAAYDDSVTWQHVCSQRYGVTWEPEVVVKDVRSLMRPKGFAVLCIATDGVWDVWTFEDAMERLLESASVSASARRDIVAGFFEQSRRKGQEIFAESADNLTGIVIILRAADPATFY
eukprot:1236664-Pleurochrysis_carterae.AAC.1